MQLHHFKTPLNNVTGSTNAALRSPAAQNVLTQLLGWQHARQPKLGHHDSLAYGKKWQYENGFINEQQANGTIANDGQQYDSGKSDIVDLTGKYPHIFGWDIGNFYSNRNYLINGVLKDDLINHIQFVHNSGGINTISWHCPNPVRNEGSGEFSRDNDANFYGGDVINNINVAGTVNDRFNEWLHSLIDFFETPAIAGIPIIFRPLHESNLNHTFWWDKSVCNDATFKSFWRVLYNIFSPRFPNFLFAYSINDVWDGQASLSPATFKQNFKTNFLARYPGNDCVDILGLDIYQKNGILSNESDANFIARFKLSCEAMNEISSTKPSIISETGTYTNSNANWWHTTFQNAIRNTPIAYAMLWRTPCVFKDPNSLGFGPYIGSPMQNSFTTFFNNNKTMFL
jgi:mannan endo-1,4-beta-mannosidase